jgi:hypothetical protein
MAQPMSQIQRIEQLMAIQGQQPEVQAEPLPSVEKSRAQLAAEQEAVNLAAFKAKRDKLSQARLFRRLRKIGTIKTHAQLELLRAAGRVEHPNFFARGKLQHAQQVTNNNKLNDPSTYPPAALTPDYYATWERIGFLSEKLGYQSLRTSYMRECKHQQFSDQLARFNISIFRLPHALIHLNKYESVFFYLKGECHQNDSRPLEQVYAETPTLLGAYLFTRTDPMECDPKKMTISYDSADVKRAINANREAFERNFWAMLQHFADANLCYLFISEYIATLLYGSPDEMCIRSELTGDKQVAYYFTTGVAQPYRLALTFDHCPDYLLNGLFS